MNDLTRPDGEAFVSGRVRSGESGEGTQAIDCVRARESGGDRALPPAMSPPDHSAPSRGDLATGTTIRSLAERSAKRTHEMFRTSYLGNPLLPPTHESSVKLKMSVKLRDGYENVRSFGDAVVGDAAETVELGTAGPGTSGPRSSVPGVTEDTTIPGLDAATNDPSSIADLIDAIDGDAAARDRTKPKTSNALAVALSPGTVPGSKPPNSVLTQFKKPHEQSAQLIPRLASKWPKPKWHQPWKLYRVISGHMGWVRSVTVDPSNEWFATGSADRTIKIWDLASGQLKLTLTGHIEQVRVARFPNPDTVSSPVRDVH